MKLFEHLRRNLQDEILHVAVEQFALTEPQISRQSRLFLGCRSIQVVHLGYRAEVDVRVAMRAKECDWPCGVTLLHHHVTGRLSHTRVSASTVLWSER